MRSASPPIAEPNQADAQKRLADLDSGVPAGNNRGQAQ
jgi:hypothetical protein